MSQLILNLKKVQLLLLDLLFFDFLSLGFSLLFQLLLRLNFLEKLLLFLLKLFLSHKLLSLVFFKLSKIHTVQIGLHLRVSLFHRTVILLPAPDILFKHFVVRVEVLSLALTASFKRMRALLLLVDGCTRLRNVLGLNHDFCNLRFGRYYLRFSFGLLLLRLLLNHMLSDLLLAFF